MMYGVPTPAIEGSDDEVFDDDDEVFYDESADEEDVSSTPAAQGTHRLAGV